MLSSLDYLTVATEYSQDLDNQDNSLLGKLVAGGLALRGSDRSGGVSDV